MARPLKDGVDYFPKDTDFYNDDKVRLLRAEFGAKGMYLLDYILCDLYSKNGYYINWDKNKCFLVSDGAGCGCTPEFVAEFVTGCIRCSFFDKRVFDLFGALTSAGIQRRFIRMLNSRENFTFIKEFLLLDTSEKKDVPAGILNKVTFKTVSFKENPVKSKENPVKSKDNSQSKVKENKIKENRINESAVASGNARIQGQRHRYGTYGHVMLSDAEIAKLNDEYAEHEQLITFLDEYIEMKGYKCKNFYLAIKKWVVDAVRERNQNKGGNLCFNPNQDSFNHDELAAMARNKLTD